VTADPVSPVAALSPGDPTSSVAVLVGREPAHRFSVHRGYIDSLWEVGARPMVLAPPPDRSYIAAFVTAALACDAVCLTGGGDVDPHLYGAELEPMTSGLDPLRDEAELAVIRAATGRGLPILGICRGIQVLAVAMGGSLYQDLPAAGFHGHSDEVRELEPVHAVTAAGGSTAEAVLRGADAVNSIHHQAVRDPGPDLRVTAWGADGVIEAIEAPGVLGVQWHPERLAGASACHLAPFEWLVGAAVAGRHVGVPVG
jgi:putative glutamine amidotransferase